MKKYFCDRCKKEAVKYITISIDFPGVLPCTPSMFCKNIEHDYCQDCWGYIRDIALNGKDLEKNDET